jgi:hypothetical protein
VSDLPLSGCPLTAVTPATQQRADSHVRNDQTFTSRELASILVIGKGNVDKIDHQLGYSQVCVPSGSLEA